LVQAREITVTKFKGIFEPAFFRGWLSTMLGACVLSAMLLSAPARADNSDTFGLQVAGGDADHEVKKIDLGLVYDPHWSWWQLGVWHFALVAEGHAAYWQADEGNVNSDIYEFGVTPVIRFIRDAGPVRPFIEGGVGVRVISHPYIATDFMLSTAFQFADMIGVGAQFGARQQYQAGFRFQHLSNASIKRPNPGLNFSEVYVQYNF